MEAGGLAKDFDPQASSSCSNIPDIHGVKSFEWESLDSYRNFGGGFLGVPRTRKLSSSTPNVSGSTSAQGMTADTGDHEPAQQHRMFTIGPGDELRPSKPADFGGNPFKGLRLTDLFARSHSSHPSTGGGGLEVKATVPNRSQSEHCPPSPEQLAEAKKAAAGLTPHPLLNRFLASSKFLSKQTTLTLRELNALNLD